MNIVYSPEAEQSKRTIIRKHNGIDVYFDRLEERICLNPNTAKKERLVIDGHPVAVYTQGITTEIFSGNVRDTYLRIELSYGIDASKERVVALLVKLHF